MDSTAAARRAVYGIASCAPPGFGPPEPDTWSDDLRRLFKTIVSALDDPVIRRDLDRRIALTDPARNSTCRR